jgi:serine/threonine protein kinase
VYDTDLPGRVIKIYHNPPSNYNVNKLRYMIAHAPDDPERGRGHASIAWPLALLKHNGMVVGFLMPKAPAGRQLVVAMSPKQRRQWAPGFLWDALVLAARNTATAFEQVHAKGYVVGDVKPENILVDIEARVTLVDNDSFQVEEGSGVVHYCPVYTQGYLPAELFGRDLPATRRTPVHDAFGLGVLMYKLLMCGAHPFVGVWRGRGEEPASDDDCVRMGSYVHRPSSPMTPRSTVPPLDVLPPDIQSLFFRCFDKGQTDPTARPNASEWRRAMEGLFHSLTKCGVYPTRHLHYRGAICPWCALLKGQDVDYFDAWGRAPVRQSTSPVFPSKPKHQTGAAPQPAASPWKKRKYLAYASIFVGVLVIIIGIYVVRATRSTQQLATQNTKGTSGPPTASVANRTKSGVTPVASTEGMTKESPKVAQSVTSYPQGQAAGAKMVPLNIELPKPMFVGTPTDMKVENLEKPLGKARPPLLVPEGTVNLAKGKVVKSSDEMPIIGEISYITDGDKEAADGSYVELGPLVQHVTVDLGKPCELYAIVVWHYHKQPRVYFDVVVQLSNDPDFIKDVKTIFNNDNDNSAGLGVGADKPYVETNEGKLIDLLSQGSPKARYVRFYSNGNTSNDLNHYIEVDVYGKAVK